MNLILNRTIFTDWATGGFLSVDDRWFSYSMEDRLRAPGVKVPGKTAIPCGRYQVVVNFSNRFKRQMPLLLNVPGFDGIRIHGGNTAEDSHGCILVAGTRVNPERIWGTMEDRLTALLITSKGLNFIEIFNGHGAEKYLKPGPVT